MVFCSRPLMCRSRSIYSQHWLRTPCNLWRVWNKLLPLERPSPTSRIATFGSSFGLGHSLYTFALFSWDNCRILDYWRSPVLIPSDVVKCALCIPIRSTKNILKPVSLLHEVPLRRQSLTTTVGRRKTRTSGTLFQLPAKPCIYIYDMC